MTRTKSRMVIGAVTALLFASAASAYSLLNPPRRWFPADLIRQVNVDNRGMASVNDPDHGVSQAVIAVERWNGAPSGTILNGVAATVNYPLGAGISVVVFADPLRICTGTCLAATTVGYYDSGQKGCCDGLEVVRYTDSDVAFNLNFAYTSEKETDGCSGEFYLEAVTTHEVGHVIGLGHSSSSSALMYASISSCNNKMLASDDTNGRDALYDCTSFTLGSCGGGGGCRASGQACTSGSQCCSGVCRGNPGSGRTCK